MQGALEIPFPPGPDEWAGEHRQAGEGAEPQLPHLLHNIRAGIEALPGPTPQELTPAVEANVRAQVIRVQNDPVIAQALAAGQVKVVGAFYDIEASEVRTV